MIPLRKSLEHFRDSVTWICKETEEFFKLLVKSIKDEIGIEPYFMGLQPPRNPLDMLKCGVHPRYVRSGLDGFFDYCFADIRVGSDYKKLQPSLYASLRSRALEEAKHNEWFVGLMVNAGWDDRYIVPHGRKISELVPRSPLRLHSCLIEVLKLNPDGIFVCSYNEWWENSGIESTIEFGDTYLKIVKYYVEKYKNVKLSELL